MPVLTHTVTEDFQIQSLRVGTVHKSQDMITLKVNIYTYKQQTIAHLSRHTVISTGYYYLLPLCIAWWDMFWSVCHMTTRLKTKCKWSLQSDHFGKNLKLMLHFSEKIKDFPDLYKTGDWWFTICNAACSSNMSAAKLKHGWLFWS